MTLERLWSVFIFLAFAFALSEASARPVSYLEGRTLMVESRSGQTEAMFAWTVTPSCSFGLHATEFRRPGDTQASHYALAMANALVKRWNLETWQGNLYLSGGAGIHIDEGRSQPAAAMMLEADAESRVYYFHTKLESWAAVQTQARNYARTRVGFSPYQVPMNALHAQLILQVEAMSWRNHALISPMLRFFYQNLVFEFGRSLEGETTLNFTTEF
jgi:hypothetical protein